MGAGLVDKLQQEPDIDLNVTWVPFELHPNTPDEGIDLAEYTGRPLESIRPMHEGLKARAAEVDLPMDPPTTLYNSRPALMLAEYARDEGMMEPLHWRLFMVNFVEGRNLADSDVLREVAAEAGLDPDTAIITLDNPEYLQRLERSMARAQAYGISGVPTFIIDDRYKIVGAQPYDYLASAFRQIKQERTSET